MYRRGQNRLQWKKYRKNREAVYGYMGEFTVSIDVPVEHMQNLFGKCDSYIRKIEDDLHVTIVDRDGAVRISGNKEAVMKASHIVKELLTFGRFMVL